MRRFIISLLAVFSVLPWLLEPASADRGRRALVQSDGTLRVGNQTLRLAGIFIPPTNRDCRTFLQPVRCGSQAVLALDTRVRGFVYCNKINRNRDGTINAFCEVDCNNRAGRCREDLGSWMLQQGWAVALPGAPFEYGLFEEIARLNSRGIWGFQVGSINPR